MKSVVEIISEEATVSHKGLCYGGLGGQDMIVFLMLWMSLDLDLDYSGDGKTVREGLGPVLAKQIEDRVTAIRTQMGAAGLSSVNLKTAIQTLGETNG